MLMMSPKMATPGLLETMVFWNKCSGVINAAHDANSKMLSRDSNYVVDEVMWQKASISVREGIVAPILLGFDQKSRSFEGCSWFNFDNLGLSLGTNLKYYTNVAEGLNQKVLAANSYVRTSYSGKPDRSDLSAKSWIGLKVSK